MSKIEHNYNSIELLNRNGSNLPIDKLVTNLTTEEKLNTSVVFSDGVKYSCVPIDFGCGITRVDGLYI